MDAFFDAFWPNLAATLVGIVLGVPIALGLNERVLERQRRLQAADERRKLKHAIDVLIDACRYNIRVLDTMGDEAEIGHVMHSPDLRITTWDAVGPTLSSGSSAPDLLQLLSHHWLRLRRIQALSDEIFAREVAKSLPPIKDKEVMLEFWKVLYGNARNLSTHAGEAIAMLEALKTELGAERAA
jgi:hypothetical protein